MNTQHEYTDEQLQAAIDAAFPAGQRADFCNLENRKNDNYWAEEAPNRLAIARAFLAALPKAAPWTLPAPPPGRRWHREDWTQDMLPEGWRPHLLGEVDDEGDERRAKSGEWVKIEQITNVPTFEYNRHRRTRRPLPAEASAEPEGADSAPPWIPHDGGPCPLKDCEVEEWEHKLRCGTVTKSKLHPSQFRSYWRHDKAANDIIAYRVLRWKPGHGPQAASKANEPAQAEAANADAEWDKHLQKLMSPIPKSWTPSPGDVVRLKSGGPRMTVLYLNDGDKIKTTWFDGCAPFEAIFPVISLTPAKDSSI